MSLHVKWHDGGVWPTQRPNPAYPHGVDLDLSDGAADTCTAPLQYPAPRIGKFEITCRACGLRTIVTTAGRPDDPRSIIVACKAARL